MKLKLPKKVRSRPKAILFLSALLLLVTVSAYMYFPVEEPHFVKGLDIANTSSVKQTLLYKAPQWGQAGAPLTTQEVIARYTNIVYARSQMASNLPTYTANGFSGKALVYLIMDEIQGPSNLASPSAQTTLCTESQKQLAVYSGNAAMDRGDFCEIHDAIIRRTALQDYPDIYPTENWFLHKANGSRYVRNGSTFDYYRPNPGDSGWRKYFAQRSLRELAPTDQGHLPIEGADGLFIDNVDLAWDKVLRDDNGNPPREYATNAAYMTAAVGFVEKTHTTLHSNGYNFPVWGNMITDNYSGTSWDVYLPYLEGGMAESYLLKWGNGPRTTTQMLNEMRQAESWINSGKEFLGEAQGDGNNTYNKFVLGGYLLVTDGSRATYKYTRYLGSSAEYYEIPEYTAVLGSPLGPKQLVTNNPLVYKRDFACGSVTVNFTAATSDIQTRQCTPTTPQGGTKNLLVIDDAHVTSNAKNSNYGTSKTMNISKSGNKVTYLKFRTAEVKNKNIVDATLVLTVANAINANSEDDQVINIASSSNWQEEDVTYNTRPSKNNSRPSVVVHGGNRGETLYVDVLDMIVGTQDDFTSFIISSEQEDTLTIYSKEQGGGVYKATLQVTYEE